jgi:hypothetical protein
MHNSLCVENYPLVAFHFICDEPSCARTNFAKRLPRLVDHYVRRTSRLEEWFTHVSFALGGEAGVRLLHGLAMTGSDDTLLEHIRSRNVGEATTPRILSVDNFSFKRRRGWGIILVDLECHRLVDVLFNRRSETFARAARLKRSTSLWHDSRLDTTSQEEESFRRHARSQTTIDHAHPYSTRNPTAS